VRTVYESADLSEVSYNVFAKFIPWYLLKPFSVRTVYESADLSEVGYNVFAKFIPWYLL